MNNGQRAEKLHPPHNTGGAGFSPTSKDMMKMTRFGLAIGADRCLSTETLSVYIGWGAGLIPTISRSDRGSGLTQHAKMTIASI